jgi:hypothetical protein
MIVSAITLYNNTARGAIFLRIKMQTFKFISEPGLKNCGQGKNYRAPLFQIHCLFIIEIAQSGCRQQ